MAEPVHGEGVERSRGSRSDRFRARRAGLPPAGRYDTVPVRIPLRDGVELGADLLLPAGGSKGMLLARGPYGRGSRMSQMNASTYAAQGYTVLFVSTRGTADSGGTFDPMRTEAADGHDVVAWMRSQEWYPGTFATLGGSYLGYTQWALLSDPPEDLVTCVIMVGPHDFAQHAWGTGTFTLDFIGWSDQMVTMSHGLGIGALARLATSAHRLGPVLEARPLAAAASEYFQADAPWVKERLLRDDVNDPF